MRSSKLVLIFILFSDGTVSYRLAGDTQEPSRGRFEMKYMGQYGVVCTFFSNSRAARVACKSVGFADGMPISGTRFVADDWDFM